MKNLKRRASTKSAQATETDSRPNFEFNTVIAVRSLVVDKFGVAWWVDPGARTVDRA